MTSPEFEPEKDNNSLPLFDRLYDERSAAPSSSESESESESESDPGSSSSLPSHPLAKRIKIATGDITHLDVDAVVAAANQELCGGAGVDGAIHRAAGPELVEASMAQAPCPAGRARITPAFNMHVEHVIHAVGPIFYDLDVDSIKLASAYSASLQLAAENRINRIAFPCISTGVYGFPKLEACEIAFQTAIQWLQENEFPQQVTFCCYEPVDADLYEQRYDDFFG